MASERIPEEDVQEVLDLVKKKRELLGGQNPMEDQFLKIEDKLQDMKDILSTSQQWESIFKEEFPKLKQAIKEEFPKLKQAIEDDKSDDQSQVNTIEDKLNSIVKNLPRIKEKINLKEAVQGMLALLEKNRKLLVEKVNNQKGNNSMEVQFRKIEYKLQDVEDLFSKSQHWAKTFKEELSILEQDIKDNIFEDQSQVIKIKEKLSSINEKLLGIKQKINKKLLPIGKTGTGSQQKEASHVPVRRMSDNWKRLCVEDNLVASPAIANLYVGYDSLDLQSKLCLLCFSIFPENYVIKRRPLINWWIAERFITKSEEKEENATAEEASIPKIAGVKESSTSEFKKKTADEVGEEIFQNLMTVGWIQPLYEKNHRPVSSCKMHPWIRRMLIFVAKKAQLFNFDQEGTPTNEQLPSNGWASGSSRSRHAFLISGSSSLIEEKDLVTLFNVNEQYLDLNAEWFSNLKNLVVLQLGRWQASVVDHIEVIKPEFLNGLGAQKHLKYLSLCGISMITQLPPSIVELVHLEILDLRACHNLQILPYGISALRKLTYLDVSECYLLDGMPKGLDRLSSLQVLKGFLIGKPWYTDYKLADFVSLKNLRKLSICIGSKATAKELDLDKLKDIGTLRILAITWVLPSKSYSTKEKEPSPIKEWNIQFPPGLEKLDLRCLSHWPASLKPSTLAKLKKLYIRGGKLASFSRRAVELETKWDVEILRLKYLKDLKVEQKLLLEEFPELKYLETVKCKGEDFEWTKPEKVETKVKEKLEEAEAEV